MRSITLSDLRSASRDSITRLFQDPEPIVVFWHHRPIAMLSTPSGISGFELHKLRRRNEQLIREALEIALLWIDDRDPRGPEEADKIKRALRELE
jgi:hypothetical protein